MRFPKIRLNEKNLYCDSKKMDTNTFKTETLLIMHYIFIDT